MTDTTANLALPELLAAQAQKHVTVNEALRALDALVQLAALDRDLTAPPAEPAEGARWIVAGGASGDWSGHDNEVAAWQDGGWSFYPPQTGWLCYVVDEGALVAWTGSAWADAIFTPAALNNLDSLGVGTAADETNPFSAKLNNALWTAQTVAEGGDGTLRYKMSKESADKTLSVLFQDNFSGRAEIGLTGDDDFHFKVSPDGAAWTEALVIDKTSGAAKVQGLTDALTGQPFASMLFTPGGDGAVSIYRIDGTNGPNPRTATIDSVSGDIITLSAAVAATFFSGAKMTGVSYIRIWNTSKTPNQAAWIKAQPASDQLQITNAADIATWSGGDTIQVGDPTAVTPGNVMALDISPMLQNVLGAVFPQKGIMVKGSIAAAGAAGDAIAISGSGASGSFMTAGIAQAAGVLAGDGVTVIPCTTLSPISNSNLVLVRENIAGTAGNRIVSSMAVFA